MKYLLILVVLLSGREASCWTGKQQEAKQEVKKWVKQEVIGEVYADVWSQFSVDSIRKWIGFYDWVDRVECCEKKVCYRKYKIKYCIDEPRPYKESRMKTEWFNEDRVIFYNDYKDPFEVWKEIKRKRIEENNCFSECLKAREGIEYSETFCNNKCNLGL